MDRDLHLTLLNNHCHKDDALLKQLSIPRLAVPFESFFGFVLELLIFFIAGSDFYSTSSISVERDAWLYFAHFVRWVVEEGILYVSWEFWERPTFRTIMLKQLTIRNLIFQARYIPFLQTIGLEQIFLLQPVVVLTLAAMHIVIERSSSYGTADVVKETRSLVSRLVSQVGTHCYLALLCLTWGHPAEMANAHLWLRTVLLTMVFQMDMLMFGVILIVLLTGSPSIINHVFDCLVLLSSGSLLKLRLRDKAGVNLGFGLSDIQHGFQALNSITSKTADQAILYGASVLHPVLEMIGFLVEINTAWFGSADLLGSLLFFAAFLSSCLTRDSNNSVADHESPNTVERISNDSRSSLYVAEAVLSLFSFVCLVTAHQQSELSIPLTWMSFLGSSVACMLSCAGLRDLLHLSRF